MTKDTIVANVTSAGALATVMANLETGITLMVLCTALFINIRKIVLDSRKDCKGTDSQQDNI